MKQFTGFPTRSQYTPIPNIFFSILLPQIDDVTELKVTLSIFETLYRKRGYPRFVTCRELLSNPSLVKSLDCGASPPETVLRTALEAATRRGVLLHLSVSVEEAPEDVYFLNTESNRQVISRIKSGGLQLSGLKVDTAPSVVKEELPDIFTLYEENIGMLTPLIADELRDAEKLYSSAWVRDAIKESVEHNKRNWRYIARILERWTLEGKSNGTHNRYPAENTDPDKYIKGKYGHMVQR